MKKLYLVVLFYILFLISLGSAAFAQAPCGNGIVNAGENCTINPPCIPGSVFASGFEKPTDSYMNDLTTNGKKETDDLDQDIDSKLCHETIKIDVDKTVNDSRTTRVIYFEWDSQDNANWLNGLTGDYNLKDTILFSPYWSE